MKNMAWRQSQRWVMASKNEPSSHDDRSFFLKPTPINTAHRRLFSKMFGSWSFLTQLLFLPDAITGIV